MNIGQELGLIEDARLSLRPRGVAWCRSSAAKSLSVVNSVPAPDAAAWLSAATRTVG